MGMIILLDAHRCAQLLQGIAVSRCRGVWADAQNFTNLCESQLPPYVQGGNLTLVIRKSAQRTSKFQFLAIVPVRKVEPGSIWVERDIALSILGVVQESVPHTSEQIGLCVQSVPEVPALDEFQEDLMHGILGTVPFTGQCYSKQQERWGILAIEHFDRVVVSASILQVGLSRGKTIQPDKFVFNSRNNCAFTLIECGLASNTARGCQEPLDKSAGPEGENHPVALANKPQSLSSSVWSGQALNRPRIP
jgi:hypothetical protein